MSPGRLRSWPEGRFLQAVSHRPALLGALRHQEDSVKLCRGGGGVLEIPSRKHCCCWLNWPESQGMVKLTQKAPFSQQSFTLHQLTKKNVCRFPLQLYEAGQRLRAEKKQGHKWLSSTHAKPNLLTMGKPRSSPQGIYQNQQDREAQAWACFLPVSAQTRASFLLSSQLPAVLACRTHICHSQAEPADELLLQTQASNTCFFSQLHLEWTLHIRCYPDFLSPKRLGVLKLRVIDRPTTPVTSLLWPSSLELFSQKTTRPPSSSNVVSLSTFSEAWSQQHPVPAPAS